MQRQVIIEKSCGIERSKEAANGIYQNPRIYHLIVDFGIPYEETITNWKDLKEKLDKLRNMAESEEYPQSDIIIERNGKDVTDVVFKKYFDESKDFAESKEVLVPNSDGEWVPVPLMRRSELRKPSQRERNMVRREVERVFRPNAAGEWVKL